MIIQQKGQTKQKALRKHTNKKNHVFKFKKKYWICDMYLKQIKI